MWKFMWQVQLARWIRFMRPTQNNNAVSDILFMLCMYVWFLNEYQQKKSKMKNALRYRKIINFELDCTFMHIRFFFSLLITNAHELDTVFFYSIQWTAFIPKYLCMGSYFIFLFSVYFMHALYRFVRRQGLNMMCVSVCNLG